MMPKLASYVVLSIDPVATLEALNDPNTTRAARKMHNKKYLGYVSDVSLKYLYHRQRSLLSYS